jgi:hypothetical protein
MPVKFTPSAKFITTVYIVEISLVFLIVVWFLSRGAP